MTDQARGNIVGSYKLQILNVVIKITFQLWRTVYS